MEKTVEQGVEQELPTSGILSDVAAIQADVAAGAQIAAQAAAAKQSAGSKFKYKFEYWLSRIVQGVFWPVFYVGYHAAFSMRINGKENIKNLKGPVIFVANHIGVYDSFMFDMFAPPFSAISPFRFMGTTKFKIWYLAILKYTGIVHLVYALFGVFKVNYGEGVETALIPAYEIIRNGGTVAIFPEGKVWKYEERGLGAETGDNHHEAIGPFKWGAAVLAKNTGAVVVPVSLRKHAKNMFRDYLTITIGKPYFVDRAATAEVIAGEMREKVVGGYVGRGN